MLQRTKSDTAATTQDSRTCDMDNEDVNKDLSLSFIRTLQSREFQNWYMVGHSIGCIIFICVK